MYGPGDVAFFDRIRPLYDLFMPATDPEPIRRGFAMAQRPLDRVVDLGGGTGRVAGALTSPDDPGTRIVVDISRGMLRGAHGAGLGVIAGDGRDLPLSSASLDGIVIVDALHHMPDRESVLRECKRVLAPGGVLVIRDFNPDTIRGRGLALSERAVGFDSTFAHPDAIAARCTDAGFVSRVLEEGFTFTVAGRISVE